MRRTCNIDTVRRQGWDGPLSITGRGRDLFTTADGTSGAGATIELSAEIDPDEHRLVGLRVDPFDHRVEGLVGTSARSGFRRRAAALLDADGDDCSLLAQLLYDLPIAVLMANAAVHAAAGTSTDVPLPHVPPPGTCAGWPGGGILEQRVEQGLLPYRPRVEAPSLDTDDPLAWHELDELDEWAFRRVRRVDVCQGRDGTLAFEGMFRDSLAEPSREVVVHEYAITGALDERGVFERVDARPMVLPGPACPLAARSADALVGYRVAAASELFAGRLTGSSTCTHLTDALHALVVLPWLTA